MATFIQQLQMIQKLDYLTAAGGALVAYDQVLTFSQEVEHIWTRQWSFMTALYLIARLSGFLVAFGLAATYMCISWTLSGNIIIFMAVNWAGNIFLLTMQAILVTRVYALFNGSKKVLIFVATFYIIQAIAVFTMTALENNNRVLHEYVTAISPAIGSVTQPVDDNIPEFFLTATQDGTIGSVVFDTVLLFFALWAFVRHALEVKTLNGRWSINVLVRTLVADHLVYFVCNLAWLSVSLASSLVSEVSGSRPLLDDMLAVSNALIVIAGPRMVVSLRAMENKTRGEGGTLEGEVSTIQFGVREPPAQVESVMEEGGAFRPINGNV